MFNGLLDSKGRFYALQKYVIRSGRVQGRAFRQNNRICNNHGIRIHMARHLDEFTIGGTFQNIIGDRAGNHLRLVDTRMM